MRVAICVVGWSLSRCGTMAITISAQVVPAASPAALRHVAGRGADVDSEPPGSVGLGKALEVAEDEDLLRSQRQLLQAGYERLDAFPPMERLVTGCRERVGELDASAFLDLEHLLGAV